MADTEKQTLRRADGQVYKTPLFVYVLTVLSAIGGFLFGYDTGVVSGAMLLITEDMQLDHLWHELIVSGTVGAAWLFALVGGGLSDFVGRKPTILGASLTFATGAVLMGAARDKFVLLAGRIVVGAGIGIASCTVPMYIAEAAPQKYRGCLVTLNSAFITGGQFTASVLCGIFAYDRVNGWRYMLGLSGIPAVIQFIGFLGMPESPRWLMAKGQSDRALSVLRSIRKGQSYSEVDRELEAIRNACADAENDRKERGSKSTFVLILQSPVVRRALVLGCALQIFQQLSGINTVMYYSANIIKMAGVTDNVTAIWLAAAVAAVNFVCTFIGLFLVEKIGRRTLLLYSLLGVILSLCVLGAGFQISELYSPPVTYTETGISPTTHCTNYPTCAPCTNDVNCGYCFILAPSNSASNGSCVALNAQTQEPQYGRCLLNSTAIEHRNSPIVTWAVGWCPSAYTWITLFGLGLYLFFFAPGMGPMPWTINSEIYPQWARGTAYSIATSSNWASNLLVSMTFLTLTDHITKEGTFYLYAGLATIAFIYFYLVLPETKGRSLEEVEGLFALPWAWSNRPQNADKIVQYVHIRGLNRGYRDSNDSGDEDS